MAEAANKQMDDAAIAAQQDLDNVDDDSIIAIADWMKKWYLKAGYKRLGRILLEHATKERKDG